MRSLLVGATLLLGLAGNARAQGVVVAPHAVYMDARTRSAMVTLYNPGTEPAEVTISSFFGYPVTDSLGQFLLAEPDSVLPSMPSAAGWIEAFPKRMTIPALQRQTIRLLARPPQGLADGEYWSRLVISAKGGSLPVSGVDTTSGISIGLTLELRTIIPLIYRKGKLETRVAVSDLRAQPLGDSIVVRARLERQGTSAYLGTARLSLVDSRGANVSSLERPIAIYYSADPAFTLRAPAVAGRYMLRLEVLTERTDLAPEQILRAPPVRDSLEVTLP
jgi:P pilus assembly chaperone PapD